MLPSPGQKKKNTTGGSSVQQGATLSKGLVEELLSGGRELEVDDRQPSINGRSSKPSRRSRVQREPTDLPELDSITASRKIIARRLAERVVGGRLWVSLCMLAMGVSAFPGALRPREACCSHTCRPFPQLTHC
jgi:hypothetical protein